MAVNPAQQMVRRDVIIEAEVVEELCRSRLTSHHSPNPLQITQRIESRVSSTGNAKFFNGIGREQSADRVRFVLISLKNSKG